LFICGPGEMTSPYSRVTVLLGDHIIRATATAVIYRGSLSSVAAPFSFKVGCFRVRFSHHFLRALINIGSQPHDTTSSASMATSLHLCEERARLLNYPVRDAICTPFGCEIGARNAAAKYSAPSRNLFDARLDLDGISMPKG
jgi:hypothetical protein